MKISVVIPTYNRVQLLKNCLKALLNQDFSIDDYEIIIVTDGRDERTNELINSLKKNHTKPVLSILSLPQKKGPAAARNMGWKNTQSNLIAFTDDDTLPQKNWLQCFVAAYNNEEKIAFTGKVIVPVSKRPTDYEKNVAHLENAEFVTANCLCTKEALEAVNGFDERYKMAWREDSDLHFKLLQAGIPVKHIKEAIVVHPVRIANWGVSIKEQKKSMYNALLYKKYPALYKQKIMNTPVWNYYGMIVLLLASLCLFLCKINNLAFACLAAWLLMVLGFTFKRLQGTSHSIKHVAEMLVTSMIIPFLSVYWTLYGAWRFKVKFL